MIKLQHNRTHMNAFNLKVWPRLRIIPLFGCQNAVQSATTATAKCIFMLLAQQCCKLLSCLCGILLHFYLLLKFFRFCNVKCTMLLLLLLLRLFFNIKKNNIKSYDLLTGLLSCSIVVYFGILSQ